MAVFVHKSSKAATRQLAKREGRVIAITPRHYLEFIQQFSTFVVEKRTELEQQREHLLSGVVKIDETKSTVEELQVSLQDKRKQLEEKSIAAKEKLQLIIREKSAAKEKKDDSLRIEQEVIQKQQQAVERKAEVEAELAAVAPAVEEAREAVSGIDRKDLREIKKLLNPPKAVKTALEGAVTLMGQHTTDWKQIRQIISTDHFVSDVKNFDSDTVTKKVMSKMHKYLDDEVFTFEKANRASKAAGPLVKWARAQVAFATQLLKIEPLTNELKQLEQDSAVLQEQQVELQAIVAELEEKIKLYEDEYAVLISEQEAIKNDLQKVTQKVERSEKLLSDLSSEKTRWSAGTTDFEEQMKTVVGDCLMASSFVAYAGYFDQSYRQLLVSQWLMQLSKSRIETKPGIEDGLPEYLSTPDDRMRWKTNSLPEDELCLQNAVMIKRAIRAPLVIDPSGQAGEYLIKELNQAGKMVVTSFLKPDQLRKDLESALRFGTLLFIQDAEKFDALINPVLNNEIQRKGGRVFINIAGKDIDLSPSFRMFLITRDPGNEFPVDICSRVTLVNFTVTRGSLQTQCVNQALRAERPAVDEERANLLRMQGEFRLRLLQLENELLDALNKAEGSILDNDAVITQLETLKKSASEIQEKVANTDEIMKQVNEVSAQYKPLAQRCAAIYFTLQQMTQIHFLYQYSLQFFLDIFKTVLENNPALASVDKEDHEKRIGIINDSIFQFVYDRVAPGMLHEHRLPLAMTFARFRVAGDENEVPEAEVDFFLNGSSAMIGANTPFSFLVPDDCTTEQAENLTALSREIGEFGSLAAEIQSNRPAFSKWVHSTRPELEMPSFITGLKVQGSTSKVRTLFRELLLLQAARPDRVLTNAHRFVNLVLGSEFNKLSMDKDPNQVLESQITADTPVLLCGAKGFDTSVKVDDFATAANKEVDSVAVGAEDAAVEAEEKVRRACASGKWVLLKNVHLAPDLLVKIEKMVTTTTLNPNFRLFLTSEISPKLPSGVIRAARVFLYEAPAGVKASVSRALQSFPESVDEAPKQRGHLAVLLAWLHGVIQERLRYAPLGWSKKYEFGEPDLRTAYETIDKWINRTAKGAASLDAVDIPWQAMRTLLCKSIYGGRIDNEIDQRLLDAFVGSVFTDKSFQSTFEFVQADKASGTPSIKPPSSTSREELIAWAASLPSAEMPTWLGLPANAEAVLLSNRAKVLAINILQLQTIDDDAVELSEDVEQQGSSSRPAWMTSLGKSANNWLALLPSKMAALKRTEESIKDPLFRFFDREMNIGIKLVKRVKTALQNCISVCNEEMKQTNDMRALLTALNSGNVPKSWLLYKVPEGVPVSAWIKDFSLRIKQLQEIELHITSGKPIKDLRVWMGGLFVPEAYITATRQSVAQANNWALEKLSLELEVRSNAKDLPSSMTNSFCVTQLRIEGATCKSRTFELVEAAFTSHELTILRWVMKEGGVDKSKTVNVPLYLNTTRSNLIVVIPFEPPSQTEPTTFYRRGVAMMCSSLSGLIA
eukprot:TRINITY_DN11816_c0_g2_i2.p1 TRINITY_DN11816_c0_g2~~TRINITY_DN11816_c0_g2_i2.p1  ORF type:complete len:1636 (+),score=529.69 TRINITY_DN11816_c0_g2_i2:364-4908(+)